jgi:mono/diheme cytochrome c family protein
MNVRHRLSVFGVFLVPLILAIAVVGGVLFARQGGFAPYHIPQDDGRAVDNTAATIQRGEYLARIGDCAACHTTRGGTPLAGGRGFDTGYGTLYSSNLTPDPQHGLGAWSAAEFAHAMRDGVARHGPLYPVFPYANFALLTDADVDALYAYLRSIPASAQTPPPNQLGFPASWRSALVVWRMLYYRPAKTNASIERGRYLVDGLGHCEMCHSIRTGSGYLPPSGYLAGARIPGIGWYAPPLNDVQLQRYSDDELAIYLQRGTSGVGTAYGPMAEVIYGSLSALTHEDALAIARYLKSVKAPPVKQSALAQNDAAASQETAAGNGAEIYKRVCADCHGADGEGIDGKYPRLRDAVAVTAPDPINAVRMVLYGGMAPTTPGNPRPYSMPPFVQQLSANEIAAVVNHIRSTWGQHSMPLDAADVESMHGIDVD